MFTATLADGKYEVSNDNGRLSFKRYGEPFFRAQEDLQFSGIVLALVQELEKLAIKTLAPAPTTTPLPTVLESLTDVLLAKHLATVAMSDGDGKMQFLREEDKLLYEDAMQRLCEKRLT